MAFTCTREGCTVAATGICLQNFNPVTDCPEQKARVTAVPDALDEAVEEEAMRAAVAARLLDATSVTRLDASLTMNLEQAAQLMRARYCHMIGIVGSPDAGKTASLVSLYLMLSTGKLQSYEFADSRTLMALDEISRGARRWNSGTPPEQMTSHTVQPDARSAGLLHLRLRPIDSGVPFDIFMPDLPGEWSTSLIDANRVDRFEFLKSADCIWIMVNGDQLRAPARRKDAIHRTGLLIRRLSEFLAGRNPKFILVVTRRDVGEIPPAAIDAIKGAASNLGREIEVIDIASFSDNSTVPAGYGIDGLIASTVNANVQQRKFWPEKEPRTGARRMLQYRCQRGRE